MVTLQQFAQGVKSFMQCDVINHLPPDRQFVAGVALGVASAKTDKIIQTLKENQLVQMLGLIEDDMIDDDALIQAMREQMNKQGSMQLEIPWIGKMIFNGPDVDALHRAIHGR